MYLQSVSITTNVVSSNHAHGEVYSIQHYVIKFASDLRQVDRWFSPGIPVSSTNKSDRHDIVESDVKHHKTSQTNLLFIAACFTDNEQIINFLDFWYDLNGARTTSRSTTLEISMLIITLKMRLAKEENLLSNICLGNIARWISLYLRYNVFTKHEQKIVYKVNSEWLVPRLT